MIFPLSFFIIETLDETFFKRSRDESVLEFEQLRINKLHILYGNISFDNYYSLKRFRRLSEVQLRFY